MPKAWSSKDERQYEHVKESEGKRGVSSKRAKEIAARTVNKERAAEGRTKSAKSGSRKSSAKKAGSSSKKSGSGSRKTTGAKKSSTSRKSSKKK